MTLWTRSRTTLASLGLLGTALLAPAQAPPSPDPPDTVLSFGPAARWPAAMIPGDVLVQAPRTGAPRADRGDATYAVLALEFKDVRARMRFEALGWPRVSAFDRFLETFVGLGEMDRFKEQARAFPGLVWMDELRLRATPPPPPPEPRQTRGLPRQPEPIVRGGRRGLTGKGVILAIVDTGVDFRNPDFITLDAQGRPVSRLLYLWNTWDQAFDQGRGGTRPPLAYPNGASVGTLYTQAQLTAELRASTRTIPATDPGGHGTSCAGVAAGNGRNGAGRPEVVGVAPEADLIAVCGRSAFLLNAAVDWLDRVRGRRPLVLSHSMGAQFGGHDGQLVQERALSARFPPETRGRALVISAGNEGASDSHAVLDLRADGGAATLAWKVPEGGTTLRLYVEAPSPDALRIVNRAGRAVDPSRLSWTPYRGSDQILIQAPLEHDGQVTIASAKGRRIRIDAFLGEAQRGENGAFTTAVVREAMVGSPGTTSQAITVGAYMWNELFDYQGKVCTLKDPCDHSPIRIGDIACYSSPGFSRSGEVKPDFAAPSDYFTASLAMGADRKPAGDHAYTDTSGRYVPFNGTSAATPYAAGVIALLFQKNPRLDLGTLRGLLATHATRDAFTGTTPNPRWGHGKLDLAAIDRLIDAAR